MNFYLKRFYDAVKDPSWPSVENYLDYQKLSYNIRYECEHYHDARSRFDEIENHDFVTGQRGVYRFQNLCYVPMPKCGSKYYGEVFRDWLGWKASQLELSKNCHMFGFMVDPSVRWLKGMTEWLWNINRDERLFNNNTFIENVIFNQKSPIIAPTMFCQSYSTQFGSWLSRIHWIPMDFLGPEKTQSCLLDFANQHDPTNKISWHEPFEVKQPPPKKLELFLKIKEMHAKQLDSSEQYIHILHQHLVRDFQFYHNLIQKFQ